MCRLRNENLVTRTSNFKQDRRIYGRITKGEVRYREIATVSKLPDTLHVTLGSFVMLTIWKGISVKIIINGEGGERVETRQRILQQNVVIIILKSRCRSKLLNNTRSCGMHYETKVNTKRSKWTKIIATKIKLFSEEIENLENSCKQNEKLSSRLELDVISRIEIFKNWIWETSKVLTK